MVIPLLPPVYVRTTGGYVFTGVCLFRGGPRSQISRGGPRSQIFGGVPGLRFLGGPRSQISGEGVPGPGLRFPGGGGYPVSVKGKFFDTRFGLIHVQTGKKIFVEVPPPSKGKNI